MNRFEHCPLTLEMRAAGVPLSTISDVKTDTIRNSKGQQKGADSPHRSLLRRKSEAVLSSDESLTETLSSKRMKPQPQKTSTKSDESGAGRVFLRLENLRGDLVSNYVYLKNNKQNGDVQVQLLLRPNFGEGHSLNNYTFKIEIYCSLRRLTGEQASASHESVTSHFTSQLFI